MARGRNDYETAQIQGRLWTPIQFRPDFWFDAADASTLSTVSGNVSQWSDKSGNSRHMSEATNRPAYAIDGRTGLSIVSFGSGSQQNLAVTGLSIAYTQQSVFVVARPNAAEFNARLWTQSDSSIDYVTSNYYIPIVKGQTGNNWYSYTAGDFRGLYIITDAKWSIFASIMGAVDLTNYYDANPSSPYLYAWPGKTFTRFGVTQDFSGASQKFIGDVAEIIVLPIATARRDRQIIEGYFAWKWALALPADHPFANRPPLIGD